MTNEEAIMRIEALIEFSSENDLKSIGAALRMAIAALRRVEWEDILWHDAKTDPPKTPGLYYGKKDDTNGMYAVNYRGGVWTLDRYPDQKMDILWWAQYAAFGRCDDEK